MNTNDIFSLKRFALYFKKTFTEDRRKYLLQMAAVAAGCIFVILFIAFTDSGRYQHYNEYIAHYYQGTEFLDFYIMFFIGTIALFASNMFSNLNDKTKRIATLTSPASTLEKYMTRWILYVFIPIIMGVVICVCSELIRCGVMSAIYDDPNNIIHPIGTNIILGDNPPYSNPVPTVMAMGILAQSLFVLGSAIWPKISGIKTIAAVAILIFAYAMFGYGLSELFLSDGSYYPNILTLEQSVNLGFATIAAGILTNYVIAYYRFKEQEIIQRIL